MRNDLPSNPKPDDVVRRLLAADAPVVLLVGPARSGKTSVVLDVRSALRRDPFDEGVVLLVPNAPAATGLNRRFVREADGVLAGRGAILFADLADDLLASAGDRATSVSPALRRLLLRNILDDLDRRKKLRALHDVADSPGIVAALDRAIAELKRSAIDPADLRDVLDRPAGRQADLLEVYDAYHRALLDRQLYDTEGKLWQARDALAAGRATLPGVRCLILDGFTDLTPTQLQLLDLLSRNLDRLLITLPSPGPGDARARLWLWTNRTRDRLRETFGSRLTEIQLSAHPPVGLLEKLQRAVFEDRPAIGTNVAEHEPLRPLQVIAAAGLDAEVAEVARRVKRLLLAGARPGEVAVLARSLEACREPIDRIFTEFGLPIRSFAAPLSAVPITRFCLDLASLPANDFAFPDVLRVLSSSYFRPRALGDFDPADAQTARMILREGNVVGGRAAAAQAVQRFAARAARSDEDDESAAIEIGPLRSDPARLAAAGRLLDALFDLAERTHEQADLTALVDALDLRAVAMDLGEPDLAARDLVALGRLEDLQARCPRSPSPAEWRDALAAESPPGPRVEEALDVLDVLDARALRWKHVFLIGCSEGQFPRPFGESALLSEADRQAWTDHGLPLDTRNDLTAREMLLFYLAASRADRSLTLSYLASRSDGGASAPGSFLEALAEPLGGLDALDEAGLVSRIPPGQYALDFPDIASPAEALRSAVANLFQTVSATTPPPAEKTNRVGASTHPPHPVAQPPPAEEIADTCGRQDARNLPSQARRANLAAGLWTLHRRWTSGDCNEYDGRLTDPALVEQFSRDVPERVVFSAGQLSTFGLCPWQYFARFVLHLAPLVEPTRRLEPVAQGLFCHNVLQRTYAHLSETHGLPVLLRDLPDGAALDALDQALAEESARVERDLTTSPAMWELQRNQLRRRLREYLQAEIDNPLAPASQHFELSFGRPPRPGEPTDPSGSADPVPVDTPAGTIRLVGKIDRVDRVAAAGLDGWMVVDYKTGSLPGPAESLHGRNTQMPLYTLALRQLLAGATLGGVFHGLDGSRKYFAALREYAGDVVSNDAFDDDLDQAIARIGEFINMMRAGRFVLAPADPKNVCPRCDFRQACHVSPARQQVLAGHGGAP
jgi:ATP-dependent helicase/nuclease subunit B